MAFQFPANPTLGQQFAPVTGTTYEWNGTGWIFLGLNTASLYPAGIILPYAGEAPVLPFQGWLLCDGKSYTTAQQPALFAVISYAYGGSGVNFNVPDLRGRVIAGADNMGGTPANRLTAAGGMNIGTLTGTGGSETVTLTAAQAPSHAHGITDVAHGHSVGDPGHAHALADPGHIHHVPDPAHTHTANDPSHAHAIPGEQGIGLHLTAGSGPLQFNSGDRAPVVVPATATAAALTGIGIGVSATGINNTDPSATGMAMAGAATGVSVGPSGTGLSGTAAAGSDQPHPNVQPTLVLNYLIKT